MRPARVLFHVLAGFLGIVAAGAVCGELSPGANGALTAGLGLGFAVIGASIATNVGEAIVFTGIAALVLGCGGIDYAPLLAAVTGACTGLLVMGVGNEFTKRPGPEIVFEDEIAPGDRLRELDRVRVVSLSAAEREFTGTDGVCRAPRVGDEGRIVHEILTKGLSGPVVVEMTDAAGHTVWIADFARQELERLR